MALTLRILIILFQPNQVYLCGGFAKVMKFTGSSTLLELKKILIGAAGDYKIPSIVFVSNQEHQALLGAAYSFFYRG